MTPNAEHSYLWQLLDHLAQNRLDPGPINMYVLNKVVEQLQATEGKLVDLRKQLVTPPNQD